MYLKQTFHFNFNEVPYPVFYFFQTKKESRGWAGTKVTFFASRYIMFHLNNIALEKEPDTLKNLTKVLEIVIIMCTYSAYTIHA